MIRSGARSVPLLVGFSPSLQRAARAQVTKSLDLHRTSARNIHLSVHSEMEWTAALSELTNATRVGRAHRVTAVRNLAPFNVGSRRGYVTGPSTQICTQLNNLSRNKLTRLLLLKNKEFGSERRKPTVLSDRLSVLQIADGHTFET
jgi:hypothetical protein